MSTTTTTSHKLCPWGKTNIEKTTFSQVMDEQYALQLHCDEEKQSPILQEISQEKKEYFPVNSNDNDTDNDLLLAQILQLEFDRENDMFIKSIEKQYNGTSKVSMSFKNFKSVHPYEEENDESESSYSEDEEKEETQRNPDGGIITKHDKFTSEKKNAQSIEQFPMSFNSGDVVGKDIRIPNHVYNKLKVHSVKEERNGFRVHDKNEHSTHEKALDENTRLIIYKMVNNETLERFNGIISTGKEAVVFHANGGKLGDVTLPSECALKVFKTTLNEFKTRQKYIKDDYRFKDRYMKQNPRRIIKLWAEKEFRNLTRMLEAGIICPRVLGLRKHILIMEFIGKDQLPAPQLKDACLSKTEFEDAYLQVINAMRDLYQKCELIHADLSEYNILWHDSKCFIIDVSQSIEPIHPDAFHFLLRDCRNIVQFFSKSGIDVMTEANLFQYVSGKDMNFIDKIEKEHQQLFEKNPDLLVYGIDSKNYSFDHHFNQMINDEKESKLITEIAREGIQLAT
ncbi:serine/threonine-protein kinase RIO3 [Hydra vulgaris]|uniref:Serine/threonine-protein kinase RIO3 n=1 Tax=Hydra vulgaris TaxID=6087 RepID=A0ABM4BQS6_HYDVU